jgi:sulfoacetaldehyde dehydrogenase
MTQSSSTPMVDEGIAAVDAVLGKARSAQARFEQGASQARYDRAALAAAWTLLQPDRNRALAELAVSATGLGNVPDKIAKNHRKTLGLMRDIAAVSTVGVIREVPEKGITEIARPIGVVGAVVPSTNPIATPANNVINALKCGNAIILAPSPRGVAPCAKLLELMYVEFDRAEVDRDLVQMLPAPPSKAKTQRLMEEVDLVIVTGSQDNVRRAYSSGTPAIGVGTGNAAVIVDESADLADAASKIAASKTFDNATSCSSENAVIVVDAIYEAFVKELAAAGGAILDEAERDRVVAKLWRDGTLSQDLIAKDSATLAGAFGLADGAKRRARFLVVPVEGVGPGHPLSGEKLSPILALYRVPDFAAGKELAGRILRYQGAGHSVGIHSRFDERAVDLGLQLPTCRVIVNQAHCFATGGAFDNGMPFSLSMGCGSWGGNSIDDNLHWRHFMNVTKVVRTITAKEPTLDEVFGDYWRDVGK